MGFHILSHFDFTDTKYCFLRFDKLDLFLPSLSVKNVSVFVLVFVSMKLTSDLHMISTGNLSAEAKLLFLSSFFCWKDTTSTTRKKCKPLHVVAQPALFFVKTQQRLQEKGSCPLSKCDRPCYCTVTRFSTILDYLELKFVKL